MAAPMAFDEIKTLPKSKSLVGHFGASGLNALGGFMAGRVPVSYTHLTSAHYDPAQGGR